MDLILWDLTDERFGVELVGESTFRSRTPEYTLASELLEGIDERTGVDFGTDSHFTEFQYAASRWVGLLNAVGLGGKILALAPEFVDSAIDGNGNEIALGGADLNKAFRRYWRFVVDTCDVPILTVPATASEVNTDHQYGPASFHFGDETLRSLAAGIEDFTGTISASGSSRAKADPVRRSALAKAENGSEDLLEINSELKDGIYRVPDGMLDIHILVNIHNRRKTDRVLVFFSGALSPGQVVGGPIFSGRSIGQNLNVPIVAISDPSISLSPHIDLGWYAGSQFSNTQETIANIRRKLREQLKVPLVLVGGSGGGFGVIEQLSRSERDADSIGIVWNPQLDIKRYGIKSVDRYLATAFPSYYLDFANFGTERILTEIEHRLNVVTNLFDVAKQDKWRDLVYLQQRRDWHFDTFLKPLGQSLDCEIPDIGTWFSDRNVSGVVADWSPDAGHTPPPRKALEALLLRAATSQATAPDLSSAFAELLDAGAI